jgi:FkbM family methyltransferase
MAKSLVRRVKDARDRFLDRVVMKRGAFRKSMHRLRQQENVYAYVAQDENGLRFLYSPTDFTIGTALIERGNWYYDEFNHFIDYIAEQASGRSAWFFDIGANIGTQTVYAARSETFSRVVAVEAIPSNYELLCANVALNDVAGKTSCHNQAVGAEPGQVTFVYNPLNPGGSRRDPGDSDLESVSLDVMRAVDFVGEQLQGEAQPDVLTFWIDVEGMEADVVASLEPLCAEREAYFCVEYNSDLYDEAALATFKRYVESREALFELTADGLQPIPDLSVVERNKDIVFTSRSKE